MKYRVAWTVTEVREEIIEANSEDEAREEWESRMESVESIDACPELFFIEDEDGNQTIYN